MNCKQARGLFSARVDGELSSLEERELREHLTECEQGCAERWVSFEATVRLVHSLPTIEPDPNFVGQVLDRVRGYEAGFVRPRTVVRPSWRQRVRSFWAEHLTVPMPVRLASVGALGLAVGFVLASGVDWRSMPGAGSLSANNVARPAVSSTAARSGSGDTSGDPSRPFADLAGDLSISGGARTQDDSIASTQDPNRSLTPQNRGDGPVQIVKSNGRPQITF